jgi:hypothetical protein
MYAPYCILEFPVCEKSASYRRTFSCPTPGSLRKHFILYNNSTTKITQTFLFFFPSVLVNQIAFPFLYISHSKRYTRVKRWSGKTQPSSTDVQVHVHLQTPPSFPSVSSSPHHTTTAKPVVAENLQTPSLISPTNYSCGNIRAGTCLLAF